MRLIQSIDPILNKISQQVFKDDLEMPFRKDTEQRLLHAITVLENLQSILNDVKPDFIKFYSIQAAAILVRLISELPEVKKEEL